MALTATAVWTSAPLRKIFDVSLISQDSGALSIAHGIDFADVGAGSVSRLLTVTLMPMSTNGNPAPWSVYSVDSQSVVLHLAWSSANFSVGGAGGAGAAVLRVQIQRIHSFQG